MNTLTAGNKNRLRIKIIEGAENYNKYLKDKCFKIICEDGTQVSVRFFQGDYKHLTGIDSDLNDDDFFNNAKSKIINVSNILTNQKYDWSTLRGKSNRIANIHELLYKDAEKTLLLNGLVTNTYVFPVAIRNDGINSCVGFVGDMNKARSLRKAGTSKNTKLEKKIIAVFGKYNSDSMFNELVYTRDKKVISRVCHSVLKELSIELQIMFMIKTIRNEYVENLRCKIKIPKCFQTDTYIENLKRMKLRK